MDCGGKVSKGVEKVKTERSEQAGSPLLEALEAPLRFMVFKALLSPYSHLVTGKAWSRASMPEKKGKYLTKQVQFGGVSFTLYSLDGVTWSSKKEELEEIHERHERQRQVLMDDTRDYMKRERDAGGAKSEDGEEGEPRQKSSRIAAESGEDLGDLGFYEVSEEPEEEESGKKAVPGRRGRPPKQLQVVKGKFKPAPEPRAAKAVPQKKDLKNVVAFPVKKGAAAASPEKKKAPATRAQKKTSADSRKVGKPARAAAGAAGKSAQKQKPPAKKTVKVAPPAKKKSAVSSGKTASKGSKAKAKGRGKR